jgi:hypothetical protein
MRPAKHSFLSCVWLCTPLILSLSIFLSACNMQNKHFDSVTWKAQRGASAQTNQRGTMVESLQNAIRTGMLREELIELLGEPDSSNAQTNVDIYELGVSPVGIDEEYYEIRYENGMVISHRWARR